MNIQDVDYRELDQAEPVGSVSLLPNLEMLRHVNVTLEVRLGQATLSVAELFQLKAGEVLVLDRLVEEPVDILLNGKTVATGHLAVSGDHLGVRVAQILNDDTRLAL